MPAASQRPHERGRRQQMRCRRRTQTNRRPMTAIVPPPPKGAEVTVACVAAKIRRGAPTTTTFRPRPLDTPPAEPAIQHPQRSCCRHRARARARAEHTWGDEPDTGARGLRQTCAPPRATDLSALQARQAVSLSLSLSFDRQPPRLSAQSAPPLCLPRLRSQAVSCIAWGLRHKQHALQTMCSSRSACHPCAGATLIFSVSFQLYQTISIDYPHKQNAL